MRMLVDAEFPIEPFNTMTKNGTVGPAIEKAMADIKPVSAYFLERHGNRGCCLIVDVPDPSHIPAIAEPLFLLFNASVQFHPVMSPEDLGNAGLDDLGKKYK